MEHTINLQFIGGNYDPTDACSEKILDESLEMGRISGSRDFAIFPKLVKLGYKLAIKDYPR